MCLEHAEDSIHGALPTAESWISVPVSTWESPFPFWLYHTIFGGECPEDFMKNPKKFYMCPRHQGGGQKSRNRLMPRRFRLGSEAINIPNPIRERKRRKHCAENGRRCGSCSDRLTLRRYYTGQANKCQCYILRFVCSCGKRNVKGGHSNGRCRPRF